MEIRRVGVVGCGLMGSGIAEVAAKNGFDVMVHEVDGSALKMGQDRFRRSMERAVEKEKLTLQDQEVAWDHLHFTTEVSDFETADIVVWLVKHSIFKNRDDFKNDPVILDFCGVSQLS